MVAPASAPPRARLAVAVIAVVALIQWGVSPLGYFRADDWTNLERAQLAFSPAGGSVWTSINRFGFYRPLVDTWHAVMFRLWGLNPWPHLAALILLFTLQTWMLRRLARERGASPGLATLVMAAAWAQPYDYAWTTLWLSNATGSLMTTFLLLALLVHHRGVRHARAGRTGVSGPALAALVTVLALLCKEEAVLLPPLVAWLEAVRWRRLSPGERRAALASLAAIALAVAAYLAFRFLVFPPVQQGGARYTFHFGLNWVRNLGFFAAFLGALPLVLGLFARVAYPAAWRREARQGPGWDNARAEILAGLGWAAIAIQLYLPIGGHAFGYLYAPSFALAYSAGHLLGWAAEAGGGEAGAAPRRRPDPALAIALHAALAVVVTAWGLAGVGWPRYRSLAEAAFAEIDRALPSPRPGALVVFLDPSEPETRSIGRRSLFNLLFDDASGEMLRLHCGRPDLRSVILAGPAALAALRNPPEADAVFLARRGRLTRVSPGAPSP